MKIPNFYPHISTGEDDNSFVGLKIKGNDVHFYYPESYSFDTENYSKDDILDLLKTIAIAKTKARDDTENVYDTSETESSLAFVSYIWTIEDYLINGFYVNTDKVYRTNYQGRVNWKRTMSRQPLISGNNLVYKDLISEVKKADENLLVEVHKHCVWKSVSLIGWLFEISPSMIEHKPYSDELKPVYLNAIKRELDRTFDDRRRKRLHYMEDVLNGLDGIKDNEELVYGVDSYNYIFERMIDHIFGNISQSNIKNFYPNITWTLEYGEAKMPGSSLRPDTILQDQESNNVYIIDSKFYRYGVLNIAKTEGLPEASSIQKQITYGRYVKEMNKYKNVFNVFILPYDASDSRACELIGGNLKDRRFVYVGYAEAEWDKGQEYSRVYTFLIDLKYVVSSWSHQNHNHDKKELVERIDQYKVRSMLS